MRNQGLIIVISGPSGVGKGTILNNLKKQNKNIRSSVSVTTRVPRKTEEEGKHYYFRSVEGFKEMINNDELIEWVYYCDNYYGTPCKSIEESINNGFDIVIEIEVEGALNIINKYPNCTSIFLLPPSFNELRNRITRRGSEDPETINKRMRRAISELKYIENYKYVVVNNEVNKATSCINDIINVEKCKVVRNKEFINEFLLEEKTYE